MRLGARQLGIFALALVVARASVAATLPSQRTYRVTIAKMAFGPTPANVRVGDTIEWVNADFLRHTATGANGSFDVDLAPGAHASVSLRRPGKIAFRCRYHPNMTGVLVVAP